MWICFSENAEHNKPFFLSDAVLVSDCCFFSLIVAALDKVGRGTDFTFLKGGR